MKDIKLYIDEEFENMFRDLDRLIKVPSVGAQACVVEINGEKQEAPFGEQALRILYEVRDLAREMGFFAQICSNRVTTIDLYEEGEPFIGILAHGDVVPPGNGWTYDPFKATLDGENIYGRGTIDDKGAIITALYAMKYIKENIPEYGKNIRLIVGSDEERGSADLAYYKAHATLPEYVFTPDADYPVINTEKGRATGTFTKNIPSTCLARANGGTVINAVPDRAYATFAGCDIQTLRTASEKCTAKVSFEFTENDSGTGTGDKIDLCIYGTGSHASLPEGGENAITALCQFMAIIDPEWECLQKVACHGDVNGKNLCIDWEDDISGKVTYSFDIMSYEDGLFKGQFDIRFPVCVSGAKLKDRLQSSFSQAGFELTDFSNTEPHHTSADSVLVKTLLKVYEQVTGQKGEALAVGGSTYAHGIPGAVAFGPQLPGIDNHMHAEDEFISIDNLKLAAQMMCSALVLMEKEV